MIEIEINDLKTLIYYARRYCDGRSTYAPSEFNMIYKKIIASYPDIEKDIPKDPTLKDRGKYFPWAQDGMYDIVTENQ